MKMTDQTKRWVSSEQITPSSKSYGISRWDNANVATSTSINSTPTNCVIFAMKIWRKHSKSHTYIARYPPSVCLWRQIYLMGWRQINRMLRRQIPLKLWRQISSFRVLLWSTERRHGHWRNDGWQQCSVKIEGWNICHIFWLQVGLWNPLSTLRFLREFFVNYSRTLEFKNLTSFIELRVS